MDIIGEQEKPDIQEVPLENQTARALGNGLRQIFPDSSLEEILDNIKSLRNVVAEEKTNKFLTDVESSANRAQNFLKALGESREIKIISDETGSDFKFSEEKTPEEKPQPGEIILDVDLSKKIRSALDHNINNIFTPILGFSEMIFNRSPEGTIKEKSGSISQKSKSMMVEFTTINSGQGKIKLSTDNQGKTTISQEKPPITQQG